MIEATRRRPRIFLGPVEIAGYYAGLEAGLRDLGFEALAVDLQGHPFAYRAETEHDPFVIRLVRRVRDRRPSGRESPALLAVWLLAWSTVRGLLVVWAVLRFDVFIFSAGVTLLRGYDLPLLRLFRKRLIVVFHGSDARPAYIDGQVMATHRGVTTSRCIQIARWRKDRIRRLERYVDVIVAQPANSHFFERPVVNWFRIGVPWRDPPPVTKAPAGADRDAMSSRPVRILHSPSDAPLKGSDLIRAAVRQLNQEGLSLDLVELQGVPNDVVLTELATCDFVVDQLYSDAPMVGFATEAAVARRPAIVGSYAWDANRTAFGAIPFPPVEECTPEGIVEAVRRLASDPEHREALGRQAHEFVCANWSRREIAQRFVQLIDGPPPADWLFDPRTLRYLEGCGLAREHCRAVVQDVLRVGGPAALCLRDKPQLEAAFVAFAGGA
jgi:glycosyltransferase involved in cell wall biosynthesis